MTPRLALIAALALGAGCIDKPGPPSEDADGGPGGDGDGGPGADGGGRCDGLAIGDPEEWLDTDEIRFDRAQGRVNGDCLDDLVIPGSRQDDGPGVFVVLGRSENMLTGGFDSFVDTGARVAADVRLVDLVGNEALDLVVLAQEDGDGSATILIYTGDGQGGFVPDFAAENNADGVALEIGQPDFPGALFLDTLQLDAGGEPSLVYGDVDSVVTLSPGDWDDDMAVADADAIAPAGVDIDASGLTDVFGVPSGTVGVQDFVLLDFDQLEWYARQAADAYVLEPMSGAVAGIGRAAYGDVDDDNVPDVVYSRVQGVWADLLSPATGPDEPGDSVQAPFVADPAFDGAINQWNDLHLVQIDDDARSDLVILALDGDGNTLFYAYPNLLEAGGDLVSDTPGGELEVPRVVSGPPYDRVVVGQFSEMGVVDLYLVTSHPGDVGALCYRAEVTGTTVNLDLCP